jgi:hypothetical protein
MHLVSTTFKLRQNHDHLIYTCVHLGRRVGSLTHVPLSAQLARFLLLVYGSPRAMRNLLAYLTFCGELDLELILYLLLPQPQIQPLQSLLLYT